MFGTPLTVARHIVLDIVLPTVDTFSDSIFAIRAFSMGHPGIGIMMLSPVLINLCFNMYLWKFTNFDNEEEKRYSWMLVILNFWPQYQVVKLLVSIYKGTSTTQWKTRQHRIKMELSYIEPFVEAVPQYFISLCIYTMLLHRSNHSVNLDKFFTDVWWTNDNEIIQVFGKESLGINNAIMFPITLSLSFLSGVKCVADYLINGPMSMLSDKKGCNFIIVIAKVVYVVIEFLNKIVIFWILSIVLGLMDVSIGRGVFLFIILSILCVLIPTLIVIPPIVRYLGLKKFCLMYFQNPQLLTLPLITDLVFGPSKGYRKCNCGCCHCCTMACCCWCFCCCKACKFDTGTEITISRGFSWIKIAMCALNPYSRT